MKIAMFSENFYPELSGISDSIISTATGLAQKGHQINFYVPKHPGKNFLFVKLSPKEIDLGKNIEIFRIPSLPYPPAPTKQGRLALPFLFSLRHIREFKPDLIHIHHNFGTAIEAAMVSRLLHIPMIGTNHTPMGEFMKYGPLKGDWALKLMLKYVSWLFNKCQWVSSPCQAVIDEMRQYGFKKDGGTVSNPIDISGFSPASSEKKQDLKQKFNFSSKTIIYAGRLAEEKKVDDIIRAAAIVQKKFPEINLAITGRGSAEPSLKKIARESGMEKNVHFLGFIDKEKLPEVYQASDVFVVMSTAETQCISMMQAMATGLPVIGARAWGLPEYISPQSGYVVEPGDYQELAKKIIYLFENSGKREELGRGGAEHVKKYERKNIIEKWEGIYQKELDKNKLKLSFVIPAWNEEKYIGQCLESIIKQAKKSLCVVEIIAVNNASTDKTRDIILSYPEVRLVDEPKKGLPQARQAGFLASTGDIIANMDADSILPSGWIERAINEFSQDEKLVALSGPYDYYDMSRPMNFLVRIFYFPGYLFHLINHHILVKGAMLQGGNFVLRRSALEKIGGFDINIKFYGEETDIARRIQKIGKVKFSYSFVMTTSGRRLRKEGVLMTAGRYAINHFWVLLFKKPLTKEYAYVGDKEMKDGKKEKI